MQGQKKISKTSSKSMYFNDKTHEAIEAFQEAKTSLEKEKIYQESILPAFDKLAENLIFIHGFAKNQTNYEVIKNDCISFLYETLNKFKGDRGTKAFSYFNVVAKNWLILNSKKQLKQKSRNISIDDHDSLTSAQKEQIELHNTVPNYEEILIQSEKRDRILNALFEIKNRIKNDKEEACINAIITIFENMDEIDMLNKRAVFVYIRELSGLSSKKLSVAMSQIRKHYREVSKSEDFFLF